MRLTRQQQQIIKKQVLNVFGTHAQVLLFGSRVIDKEKGGDIDLLIELEQADNDLLKKNLKLNAILQIALGGLQKIDIITHVKGSAETSLHKVARNTGVLI